MTPARALARLARPHPVPHPARRERVDPLVPRHLGPVDEALRDADVDEQAEAGHLGHRTLELLTLVELGDPLRLPAPADLLRVIGIDRERERISLSIRRAEADPWSRVGSEVVAGQDLEATVTKLMPFGAFARIAQGLEGLVHVSELSEGRVADPSEIVAVGDRVRARVVGVDRERRRLSLSVRQAGRWPHPPV